MASDANHILRGVSVGALSTVVTAAAHSTGAGSLPSESGFFLLVLVCAALGCAAAARHILSRARLMGALAAAQALGHLALSATETHAHGGIADSRMLWAHLMAVGAGAYLIAAAERGIRWAVTALRRIVSLVHFVPGDRTVCVPARQYGPLRTARLVDLSGTGTRGPPLFV